MSQAEGPPDRSRCPVCGGALPGPRCPTCGTDLAGPLGDELWWIDNQLHALPLRRAEVVRQLRGTVRPPPPPAVDPWQAPPQPGLPPPPASWPPPAAAAQPVLASSSAGPEVSSILLALGVALLVLAALVFAVVSWDRLGALGQGAVLVGLTLVAGSGTRAASRRGLTGTAEALGVLTVVMGPLLAQAVRITLDLPALDDRSWANWVAWSWWPGVLAVVGVAAIAFGRRVGISGAPGIGIVLVQVAGPAWIALAPLPPAVLAVALAGQAALVAVGPTRGERAGPATAVWDLGAVLAWPLGLAVALAAAPQPDASAAARWGAVAGFAACAVAAVRLTRRPPGGMGVELVAGAAAVAAFAAWTRALGGAVPDVAFWPLLGLAAVAGIVVAGRLEPARGEPLRSVSWTVAVVAAAPVADAVAALVGEASTGDAAWRGHASAPIEVVTGLRLVPAGLSLVAGALVLALAGAVDRRRLAPARLLQAGWVLGALTVLALPGLVGVRVDVALVAALSSAAAFTIGAWVDPDPRRGALAALAGVGLAVAWAAPDPGLLLAPAVASAVLGGALSALGIRRAVRPLAVLGAVVAVGAVVATAALLAARADTSDPWTWALASVVAVVLAPLVSWAAPRPMASTPGGFDDSPADLRRAALEEAASLAEAVAIGLHLTALAGLAGTAAHLVDVAAPGSVALAAGAVGFALVAIRRVPAEVGWWAAALSGLEVLGVIWLRLAVAGVTAVEAYTLPGAVLLAVGAWAAGRAEPGGLGALPSWRAEGPALAMAIGPTALVALGDAGLVRQLVGLAVGAAALGIGAATRRRAPVDVGAVVLAVVGLQALLPYADDVPRWLSLGLAGAVLVALGATFEQRRRDLGEARRRYAALR